MMEPSVDRRRLAFGKWKHRFSCVVVFLLALGGWSNAQVPSALPLSAQNEGLRTTTNGWMEIADNMVSGSNIQNSGCLR